MLPDVSFCQEAEEIVTDQLFDDRVRTRQRIVQIAAVIVAIDFERGFSGIICICLIYLRRWHFATHNGMRKMGKFVMQHDTPPLPPGVVGPLPLRPSARQVRGYRYPIRSMWGAGRYA